MNNLSLEELVLEHLRLFNNFCKFYIQKQRISTHIKKLILGALKQKSKIKS
ncbi:hypothetical protein D3C87_962250 [compost metagenome]